MLEHFYAKPSTIDRVRDSWLGSQIDRYVGWMEASGYSFRTVFRGTRIPAFFSETDFLDRCLQRKQGRGGRNAITNCSF